MAVPEPTTNTMSSATLAVVDPESPESAAVAARREARPVLWGAILLAIFACWWSTVGADLSDDGHNIALAWRMSLGDAPFVDEMNPQATGVTSGCAVYVVMDATVRHHRTGAGVADLLRRSGLRGLGSWLTAHFAQHCGR
jgi:hypothetical protein